MNASVFTSVFVFALIFILSFPGVFLILNSFRRRETFTWQHYGVFQKVAHRASWILGLLALFTAYSVYKHETSHQLTVFIAGIVGAVCAIAAQLPHLISHKKGVIN